MDILPSGTVVFLFTDIEGSTQLWENHRDEMQEDLARHDTLLRDTVESNEGHVFKTVGDAFCAVFSTSSSAVKAALDAQRVLRSGSWRVPEGIRVRMALHVGEAEERDEDYFGPTVNRVARFLRVAHGRGGESDECVWLLRLAWVYRGTITLV